MNLAKNLFICGCIVVISASLSFALWANFALSTLEAVIGGVALLVVQVVAYLFVWKAIIYRALLSRIQDLALAEADNANAVERLGNELQGLRKHLKTIARGEIEPIARELEVIGSLIKQLAENSSELDGRMASLEARSDAALATAQTQATSTSQASQPAASAAPAAAATSQNTKPAKAATTAAQPALSADEWLAPASETTSLPEADELSATVIAANSPVMQAVRNAVDNNKVDLYLQPIVSLPQRKPKFYEALSRIRDKDGALIRPAEFIKSAEQSGAMPVIDKMLLVRAIQVLRRLLARKADAIIVCNISASSLADSNFFDDFKKLLRAKPNLANHVIFEFDQMTVNSFGPLEEETLRALKALGFHFAIDNVVNLSLDFRYLVNLGFHYVKVSADTLLSARESGIKDIQAEDIPRYFARNGVQLIVSHVETEHQVVELLDFDIALGQGFLFASPREVKPDSDVPKRRSSDLREAS